MNVQDSHFLLDSSSCFISFLTRKCKFMTIGLGRLKKPQTHVPEHQPASNRVQLCYFKHIVDLNESQ